jgi:pimeloyl-ACP methyl ester carboxylesterase
VEVVLPYLVPRWTFRVALWRAYGKIGHASPRDIDEYWAPTRDPAFVRVLCRLSHTFDWTHGDPDELARVRCPTTVLFGEHDHLVRSDASRTYVECLPQARWEVVPGAGHTLPEEVPERVNAAVLAAARALAAPDSVASSVAMS